MASTTAYFDAIKGRRSIYRISSESTISDERIEEIVKFSMIHSPSTFNVQSARAVLLLGDNHRKLWQKCAGHMKSIMSAEAFAGFEKRIKGFEDGHGTVMFFEDEIALEALKQKNAMIVPLLGEWSQNSSGIHQYVVWTALAAEGLGCNLQHYNFMPAVTEDVLETWNLPKSWKLNAQLVLGKPTGDPLEKTFNPIEDRVKIFA